jgi:hypothetical protein
MLPCHSASAATSPLTRVQPLTHFSTWRRTHALAAALSLARGSSCGRVRRWQKSLLGDGAKNLSLAGRPAANLPKNLSLGPGPVRVLKGVDLMLRNSSFTHRDRLSSSAWVKCVENCHLM